eukprot:scaffold146314_cov23-Prasinocladus_malaysianus.AAC.1
MMKARPNDNWCEEEDADEPSGVKSAADLPLSLSLVASGHRRKTILRSYLANEYKLPGHELDKRVQGLRAATQRHGLAAFVAAEAAGEEWEDEEDVPVEVVRDRAYSMLPPRMRGRPGLRQQAAEFWADDNGRADELGTVGRLPFP